MSKQDEYYSRRGRVHSGITILVILALSAIAFALTSMVSPANASVIGGSDSPTPYTVDSNGITLPSGYTFPDNGHVNIRSDKGNFNLHFESKCITRTDAECAGSRHAAAQFIGKSFIPWSAFWLNGTFCVSWVQISQFNEHFGEGGQSAVCVGVPNPEPTPTPTPTVEPTPEPTPTVTPTPEPTVEPTPEPTVTPNPEPTTEPTVEPTVEPTPVPSTTPPVQEPGGELAPTGSDFNITWALLIIVPLVAGLGLLVVRKIRCT